MRNAAMFLGIIAGLIGIVIGLFGFGYAQFSEARPEIAEAIGLFDNPALIKFASFAAPLLAIAGGAMAKDRGLWGGIALLVAAVLFYQAFGFNVATMFPIGFAGLGGVLAITARQPDSPKSH